ncbi:hypothetical protein BKA70DRAFT_554989 [Coprinopsis sp. MPI-PUGE-AT-0042]|nr:hypothetical protein BKA70DRAFT_554989 [Coprinopsis sp. MPI-PUGE-AT-0042]
MNVKVKSQESVAQKGARYVLVATKDFASGETIYTEHPIVAVLDHDLQAAGTHCTNCFRTIDASSSVKDEEASSVFPSYYCSQTCLLASLTTSNGLLFTGQSPLPEALLAGPMPDLGQGERKEAQAKFADYVASEKRNNPLLAARFIARQVVNETSKLAAVAGAPVPNKKDYPDAEEGEYTLADHTERWRYIDVATPDQELPLLSNLLKATLPGLEAFTTESQYSTLVGKMAYNAIGVVFGQGRDDRPVSAARPEDVERSRTAHGTARQVGSAIYNVSSFLTHSCSPSALVSFPSGTTQLELTANKDLKAGDVLTIAYVDVKQKEAESMAECKRRRRVDLVRGWKFACACERCEHEADQIEAAAAATAAVAAPPGPVIVDESVLASALVANEAEFPPLPATEVEAPTAAAAADEAEFPPLPEAEAEVQAPVAAEVEVEAPVAVETVEAALVETAEEAFVTVEAEPVGDCRRFQG